MGRVVWANKTGGSCDGYYSNTILDDLEEYLEKCNLCLLTGAELLEMVVIFAVILIKKLFYNVFFNLFYLNKQRKKPVTIW